MERFHTRQPRNHHQHDGRLKGISYTVCAEDYTDANFSDFCLNVVAWVK